MKSNTLSQILACLEAPDPSLEITLDPTVTNDAKSCLLEMFNHAK